MQRMSNQVKNMRIVLLMLFAALSLSVSAQTITLKGNVKDATGEPIIGASVVEKGNTTNGSITDLDGKFNLKVPSKATVVISYIGMRTQEVAVNGKSSVNITLEDDAQSLEEVVVIGYGTAKKKDLTGSVGTVQGAELAKVPVTSAAQALTGRLAGVQITTTDGSPDAEMIIRVRGGGSITGDNSPLYIVDGFPVSSISDVAPNDIQDITVLKDASSTAIYGSQGANGVVLITTKSAKSGKTQVTYSGYIQGKTLSNKIDVMNPYEFVMYNYERAAMKKSISNFEKRFGAFDDLDLYQYQKGTNWQEEMFGNADLAQSHNINVSGGSDKTKFTLSGSYIQDGGLMKNNDFNRVNLNFKLNHEIAKGLKLDFGIRFSDTETNGIGTSGGTYKIRSYESINKAPVNGLYDFIEVDTGNMDDDELDTYLSDIMTLQEKVDQYWRKKNERRYNFTGGLSWNILKNLRYRLEGGYEYTFYQLKNWYGPKSDAAIKNGDSLPYGEWDKKDSWKYRIANTLTYDFKLSSRQDVDVMIGQEIVTSGGESISMTAKRFQKDITPEKMFASMASNSGEASSKIVSSSLSQEDKMASFFGRINYRFDERYLLTVTMRADGSSKFSRGNRWGFFPAAAVGWRISEEPFMLEAKDKIAMSNLKMRLSYGQAGNNRIASGMFETLYKAYSSSKYYGAGNILNPHYTLSNAQLANPNLKWETTTTRNLGLDFGFFNERLNGNIDLYWNSTADLLIKSKINAMGYTEVQENVAETSNKGIEISLNGNILQKKNYSLNVNFNIGFNRNRVEKLKNGITSQEYNSGGFSTDLKEQDDYRVIVGEPLGIIYGFVSDGYYSVDDFETYVDGNGTTQFKMNNGNYVLKEGVANNAYTAGSVAGLRPGSIKLKDLDNSGTIDAKDRQIIGRTAPKHTGGFGINGTVYGFDISATFNWVYGNQVYNLDKIATTQTYRTTYANMRDYMSSNNRFTYLDRATGEIVTDYATLKAMNEGKEYWSPLSIGDNSPIVTSWAVEDGSYLRFQNLTVGYTLPQSWTKKFACNQFRVYCTLNNIWTWTKYTGYDPEVNSSIRSSSTSGLTPGADFSSYPKSFSWTVGLNLSF